MEPTPSALEVLVQVCTIHLEVEELLERLKHKDRERAATACVSPKQG